MRYLVFAGHHYYSDGGMNDWIATCDCLEDVTGILKNNMSNNYDWFHVFDIEERKVVERGNC